MMILVMIMVVIMIIVMTSITMSQLMMIIVNLPNVGSKAALANRSMNSLNRPPPSIPASERPIHHYSKNYY